MTLSNKPGIDDEKSPKGLSSLDTFLTIESITDNYEIRHPKPSISKNTARKMLNRDLNKALYQRLLEVIGADEPNKPLEMKRADGTRMVQINPRNSLRAAQRKALAELMGQKE